MKKIRNTSLDAWRGLFLLIMCIDHFPTFVRSVTYEFVGFVSAAEGFVFLSGYLAGAMYCENHAKSSDTVFKKAIRRFCLIYLCHIILFFTLMAFALFGTSTSYFDAWMPFTSEHPLRALLLGCTLIYRPPLLDLLPMYCIFTLIVPVVIICVNRIGNIAVLCISGFFWYLAQLGVLNHFEISMLNNNPIQTGYFDINAWQLLFILGMVFGGIKIGNNTFSNRSFFMTLPCVIIVVALFVIRHNADTGIMLTSMIQTLSVKSSLGPIRVLDFVATMYVATQFVTWQPNNIITRSLALLGRHSLPVYLFHVILVYFFCDLFLNSLIGEVYLSIMICSLFIFSLSLDRTFAWRQKQLKRD